MATPITQADFEALSYGYLTGKDLIQYCPFQALQRQYATSSDIITNGVNTAYAELISKLGATYDMDGEFANTGAERDLVSVKRTAIKAIENVLGGNAYQSEKMSDMIKENNAEIKKIQQQQTSLKAVQKDAISPTVGSITNLTQDSFSFIG
jgi:hypothetical protein